MLLSKLNDVVISLNPFPCIGAYLNILLSLKASESNPNTIPSRIVGHNNSAEIAPGELLKIKPSDKPRIARKALSITDENNTRVSEPIETNSTSRNERIRADGSSDNCGDGNRAIDHASDG